MAAGAACVAAGAVFWLPLFLWPRVPFSLLYALCLFLVHSTLASLARSHLHMIHMTLMNDLLATSTPKLCNFTLNLCGYRTYAPNEKTSKLIP